MADLAALRQTSTVGMGDREVVVTSRVLLDPEPMIFTEVTSQGEVLAKSHVTVPSADARDVHEGGGAALASTLRVHHLRYVHTLIGGGQAHPSKAAAAKPEYSAGTLARVVVGAGGRVEEREGENQVPGTWLSAAFLAVPALDELDDLGLGTLDRASIRSNRLSVILVRAGDETRLTFLESRDELPRLVGSEVALPVPDANLLALGTWETNRGLKTLVGDLPREGAQRLLRNVHSVTKGLAPEADFVDLVLTRGRVALVPFAGGWLCARIPPDGNPTEIIASLAERLVTPPPASSERATSPEDRRAVLGACLSQTVRLARPHLGFPVIRNYFKKAQDQIADAHPWMRGVTFSLDGTVTIEPSVDPPRADLFTGASALVEAFAERATRVAPALASTELLAALDPLAERHIPTP
jgi:hypothetical protein